MTTISKPSDRIFVALDTTDVEQAVSLAEKLRDYVGGVKMGKEFFTANGPQGVARVSELGMPVFLDLKWHDIPNTVAGALKASLPLKPLFVNVHASGGAVMMGKAAEAAAGATGNRPLVLGVTVLTSMSQEDLDGVGVESSVLDQVVRLAKLAKSSGLDGVVCSAKEIAAIREACGKDFALMVPGIRPAWAARGDQKRIMTPVDAVAAGADYLVIGRPITQADDPVEAAKKIAEELGG